jgi:hypothetical protein
MKPTILMLLAAASLPLGACASTNSDSTLASAGTSGVMNGAVVGSPVGGLAGAVWADRDNDGRADGYVQNGQYYPGAPGQYQSAAAPRDCHSVGGSALTGAGVGAATGAGVGALAGGVSVLGGALVGAAVGGLAGAIWADANNDGCVDGYIREGQYYEGAPYQNAAAVQQTSGERG